MRLRLIERPGVKIFSNASLDSAMPMQEHWGTGRERRISFLAKFPDDPSSRCDHQEVSPMMELESLLSAVLSSWIAIPLIFVVRFFSSLLTEIQTLLVVWGRVRSATLLAGVEDLLYWASIGLVIHETSRGYL